MGRPFGFQMPVMPPERQHPPMTLDEAIQERDAFLEQYPMLYPFQEEINRRLTHAGNDENRMAVLGFMIEANLTALFENLCSLLVQIP